MQNLLTLLNTPQQQAVRHVAGPLLVLAGAGSGKTRVITHKIAYLIKNCGIQAKHITAITFTNKTAKEMNERTSKLLNRVNTRGLTICTFHSLGLKILREECANLGYKKNFSMLDSYDSGKIISDILGGVDRKVLRNLQTQISLWKNEFLTPEQVLQLANDDISLANARIYQEYQDTLKTYQAVDFDDLILLPVNLLKNNLNVLHKWQLKIRYLLIDEYQDTNVCQYQLIKLLTGNQGNFTAVGDDDQSIYAWRGAKVENLMLLQKDYPKLEIIKLEQNYRSTNTILNSANNVIAHNQKLFDKKLWSAHGDGELIKIVSCQNDEDEADIIARKIMVHRMMRNGSFKDYAILYRGNHQARVIEQALRNFKLPYTISGGQSLFDKTEIKDIMSYLRLILNQDDDSAFIRAITTPKRGIGQVTLEKLSGYAATRHISLFEALFEEGFANTCNPTQLETLLEFGHFINELEYQANNNVSAKEILQQLVTDIGYEHYLNEVEDERNAMKRWESLTQFMSWLGKRAEETGKSLAELVHNIMLITMIEENEEEVDAIKMTTLHASKGLEYPYVYLIGCEEGILPHQESVDNEMVDEERRLMYVAITRAQFELTISYCDTRKRAGTTEERERSRFIDEISEKYIFDENATKHVVITDKTDINDKFEQMRARLKQITSK